MSYDFVGMKGAGKHARLEELVTQYAPESIATPHVHPLHR